MTTTETSIPFIAAPSANFLPEPTNRCTWCDRVATALTPAEGDRLCWPCTEAYLAAAAGDARAAHFGESFRHARPDQLPVTPRGRR